MANTWSSQFIWFQLKSPENVFPELLRWNCRRALSQSAFSFSNGICHKHEVSAKLGQFLSLNKHNLFALYSINQVQMRNIWMPNKAAATVDIFEGGQTEISQGSQGSSYGGTSFFSSTVAPGERTLVKMLVWEQNGISESKHTHWLTFSSYFCNQTSPKVLPTYSVWRACWYLWYLQVFSLTSQTCNRHRVAAIFESVAVWASWLWDSSNRY